MGPKLTNQGSGDPSLAPGQPVYGLLQADFVYQENVDSGHPLNLDYFIPINCQTVKTARLSFRLRLYRTYSNFSVTGTSSDSTDTTPAADATGESGHSHNHTHRMFNWNSNGAAPGGSSDWVEGAGTQHITFAITANPPTTLDSGSNAAGSSGHSHSHTHGAHHHTHSHTVSGNSFLGVTEDINNSPSYTIQFDGVDQTAAMIPAGPYTGDQVELDVTKFLSTKVDRIWHVISLSPNARGRIQAVLRVLYNSNLV